MAKLEEEENNPMKALENRTTDSKRDMDILDALQDIRARNARNERISNAVDLTERLGAYEADDSGDDDRRKLGEEDERLVNEIFSKIPLPGPPAALASSDASTPTASTVALKRKAGDVEPDLHSLLPESTRLLISSARDSGQGAKKKKKEAKLGVRIVRKGAAEKGHS